MAFDMESRQLSDPMDGRTADSGFGQDHFLVFAGGIKVDSVQDVVAQMKKSAQEQGLLPKPKRVRIAKENQMTPDEKLHLYAQAKGLFDQGRTGQVGHLKTSKVLLSPPVATSVAKLEQQSR